MLLPVLEYDKARHANVRMAQKNHAEEQQHEHHPTHHIRPGKTMTGGDVFVSDLSDFETAVVEASREMPVLVDFWADWCAPCHAIAPHLDRVMEHQRGRLRLAKVEVDEGENMKLAGRYRLRGFPTLMLFVDGEEAGRFSGARSTQWIEHWLDQHLDNPRG